MRQCWSGYSPLHLPVVLFHWALAGSLCAFDYRVQGAYRGLCW